jgi:hypothetical protein
MAVGFKCVALPRPEVVDREQAKRSIALDFPYPTQSKPFISDNEAYVNSDCRRSLEMS